MGLGRRFCRYMVLFIHSYSFRPFWLWFSWWQKPGLGLRQAISINCAVVPPRKEATLNTKTTTIKPRLNGVRTGCTLRLFLILDMLMGSPWCHHDVIPVIQLTHWMLHCQWPMSVCAFESTPCQDGSFPCSPSGSLATSFHLHTSALAEGLQGPEPRLACEGCTGGWKLGRQSQINHWLWSLLIYFSWKPTDFAGAMSLDLQ